MIPYKHLLGYIERYTIIRIGKLHIRLQRIKRGDITPYLHTHPYSYISVVLWGGYFDRAHKVRKRTIGSILFRSHKVAHRIEDVLPSTLTLFFTWRSRDNLWTFDCTNKYPSPDWIEYDVGVYVRKLYGRIVYSKFDKYWFVAATSIDEAVAATRPSIDQNTSGELVYMPVWRNW